MMCCSTLYDPLETLVLLGDRLSEKRCLASDFKMYIMSSSATFVSENVVLGGSKQSFEQEI